jgi:hypothetical protein
MNNETMSRLKKASEYEKMAIKALFPERAARHIEVIEKEIHTMFMEMVVDAIRYEEAGCKENCQNNTEKEKTSKVKKVNIG